MSFIKRIWQTYRQGKKYPQVKTELEQAKQKLNVEEDESKSLGQKVNELQKALKEARNSIKQLKDGGPESPDPQELKNFFMYPDEQNYAQYDIRGEGRRPVELAFRVDDESVIVEEAKEMVAKGGLRRKNDPTQVIDYCYRYVENNWGWNYETDKEQFGKIEYWMKPDKALESKTGDCEDKGLAMHLVFRKVLELAGFKEAQWRIRLAASRTLAGGHAYNIWLAEDCEWYVVESTMDAEGSRARTWKKTPLRNNNFYYNFYFFATPHQTWRGDLDVVEPYNDSEHKHYHDS